MREFFDRRGFVEVETPILNAEAGGATAKPFVTRYEALHSNFYMRIAPELYLKRLVVGGMDRVYEIGKVFRNEHIDRTHVPEFTTCEFYQAYASCEELMDTTENLLRTVVKKVTGSSILEVSGKNGKKVPIDFSKSFGRIEVIPFLEKKFGTKFPQLKDEEAVVFLTDLCVKNEIPVEQLSGNIETHIGDLVDSLIEKFIEPLCISPTFICGQPIASSPLAKKHPSMDNLVADRFELFVNGTELCNAYTELNDPDEQRTRFAAQRGLQLEIQNESGVQVQNKSLDASEIEYCHALELGLPPTAGWGMGIDRLVMLLTGESNIREVVTFPKLRTGELEATSELKIASNSCK